MFPSLRILVATLSTCALLPQDRIHCQEIDPDCLRRIREEAMPSWEAFKAKYSNVRFKADQLQVSYYLDGGELKKLIQEKSLHFRQLDQLRRLVDIRKPRYSSRIVANERYRFEVETEKYPGVLCGTERVASMRPSAFSDLYGFEHYCLVGVSIWTTPLDQMLVDERFRLVDTRFVETKRGPRARISFMYVGRQDDRAWRPGMTGWAELDPDRNWLADRTGTRFPNGKTVALKSMSVEYRTLHDNSNFPKLIRWERSTEASSDLERDVCDVEIGLPEPCGIAQEEFYLEHYGFSEASSFPSTKRNLNSRYFIGAMAIGLFVFIWVVRKSQRGG